jgi:hypothetical protein
MEMIVSNETVLIDDEDYPLLSRYNWYVKHDKFCSYVVADVWLNKKRHKLFMHRFVMGMRNSQIDHANRNSLDNRKQNLRFCSSRENVANRRMRNQHGFKGVTRYKNCTEYVARIYNATTGVRETLGKFKTAAEAAQAHEKRAIELYGAFAYVNAKETT